MSRPVPFNDPRMCGDHFNSNIFMEAEVVDFVIDWEQGVILEWRALLDGEVYERHWFNSVTFDPPLDDSLFVRSRIPTEITVNR